MLDSTTKCTPEEYLVREAAAEYKSEYYQGEIRAMAGGSADHSLISVNVTAELRTQLENTPCRVFNSDMRLLVEKRGDYTYPDAMVICGKIEFPPGRADVVTNPIVIVEVLSPATRQYDLIDKFALYKQMDSLQEYVLVDSERVHVTLLRRESATNKWTIEMLDGLGHVLVLDSLGLRIPLARLYDKVEFVANRTAG